MTRIFLSWCHRDEAGKDALLHDLLPALGIFTDLKVEWWEDSHLTCGSAFFPGIIGRLDEADFGLLLLSTHYLASPFIREHELPRFAGPSADKGALPVALMPLPPFTREYDYGGVQDQQVFSLEGRSFTSVSGARRPIFATQLAAAIRRRVLGQDGYRPL